MDLIHPERRRQSCGCLRGTPEEKQQRRKQQARAYRQKVAAKKKASAQPRMFTCDGCGKKVECVGRKNKRSCTEKCAMRTYCKNRTSRANEVKFMVNFLSLKGSIHEDGDL
jgi:hypothetical protein